MSAMRGALFNLGYALITIVWGTLSLLVGWFLPYRLRFRFIVECWSRLVLAWLRVSCGIRHQVEGLEHTLSQPCVVLAKHQSSWETFFLQTVFSPQSTVIKRELLHIPFFGWAFRLLKPIAIDRSQRLGAIRQLLREGCARLSAGIWVVLLPEGTRVAQGERVSFYRGGAALAHAQGCAIIVVAHNAGRYWPARHLGKVAGCIRVRISPPIPSAGRTVSQLNAEAERWLDTAMAELELGTSPGGSTISSEARAS